MHILKSSEVTAQRAILTSGSPGSIHEELAIKIRKERISHSMKYKKFNSYPNPIYYENRDSYMQLLIADNC